MRILSNFWTPIVIAPNLGDSTFIHLGKKLLELNDNFFTNPYRKTMKASQAGRTVSLNSEISPSDPLAKCIGKILPIVFGLFYRPKSSGALIAGMFLLKCIRRYRFLISDRRPPPPIRPSSSPISPPIVRETNVDRWMRKFYCDYQFHQIVIGKVELPLRPYFDPTSKMVEIIIGENRDVFPEEFLKTIPYFRVLLNEESGWRELKRDEEHDRFQITLNGSSEIRLKLLKMLERGLCTIEYFENKVEIDFLGVESETLSRFIWFQDFALDQSTALPPDVDFERKQEEPPVNKIGSYSLSSQPFQDSRTEIFFSKDWTSVESSLNRVGEISCKGDRYLFVNKVIDGWILYLHEQNLENTHQLFLKLFLKKADWMKYLTMLQLPPFFHTENMRGLTQHLEKLRWSSVDFFHKEPGDFLSWVDSWKNNCRQLEIFKAENCYSLKKGFVEGMLKQMPSLDICEI